MNDKHIEERSQLTGRCNYWQSLKWQDRFEEVREDVEAYDFSAKDELFQLAQFALLDNEDSFFKLIPTLLSSSKLKLEQLNEWPIFRNMRECSTYHEKYKQEEIADNHESDNPPDTPES